MVICILGVQMKMAALVWGISSITFSRTFLLKLVSYLFQFITNVKVVFLHNNYLSPEVRIWFVLQKFWKAQYSSFLYLRFVLLVTYFKLSFIAHHLKIILVLMHVKLLIYSLCWILSYWLLDHSPVGLLWLESHCCNFRCCNYSPFSPVCWF